MQATFTGKKMFRRIFAMVLLLALSACGFHLKGPQPLPFASIYLGLGEYSDFAVAIKRQIALSGNTQVVDNVADAEVRLIVVRDGTNKSVESISGSGTVSEYLLAHRFAFRLVSKQGREVMPLNEIYVSRTMSFSSGLELSKEQEEALLYQDMQKDIVQQLVRRLGTARMDPPPAKQ
jgi:LPS-assembly lipoprotein